MTERGGEVTDEGQGVLGVVQRYARLEANAMVALTLLVAESDPRQKDMLIRFVLQMLGDGTA